MLEVQQRFPDFITAIEGVVHVDIVALSNCVGEGRSQAEVQVLVCSPGPARELKSSIGTSTGSAAVYHHHGYELSITYIHHRVL